MVTSHSPELLDDKSVDVDFRSSMDEEIVNFAAKNGKVIREVTAAADAESVTEMMTHLSLPYGTIEIGDGSWGRSHWAVGKGVNEVTVFGVGQLRWHAAASNSGSNKVSHDLRSFGRCGGS